VRGKAVCVARRQALSWQCARLPALVIAQAPDLARKQPALVARHTASLGRAQVWDLGGQTSIRPYWRCYYPNTQAIIYVVDSSDTERIGTSAEEFHAILDEEELKDALILVYANKQARRACRQVQSRGTLRGLVSGSGAARRAPVVCPQAAPGALLLS